MSSRSSSQEFAHFAALTTWDDIPESAQDRARIHLLDTLGAGIVGVHAKETQMAIQTFESSWGKADIETATTVWGANNLLPPLPAAFVNGISSHAFELDDSGGCDHSGAVVVPAIFSAISCVEGPVSGTRVLEAIVLGYELARRVQNALGGYDALNEKGWHSTGVCGPFGAAVAVSHLLGLPEASIADAIGLAGSSAGGTWAFITDGAMSKRMHVGQAAETGLKSALLAAEQFTGPKHIFDAKWGGFLELYGSSDSREEELTENLGSVWQIERASIKPHATCRSTHSAIDLLFALMEKHQLTWEAIESIDVHTSELIYDMCGNRDVSSLVTAQLSMPFALATAAVSGSVKLEDILAPKRSDQRVLGLMERITVSVNAGKRGGSALPTMAVRAEGKEYLGHASAPRGDATNRLSDQESIEKFMDLAVPRIGTTTASKTVEKVMDFEGCDDVSDFPWLLKGTSQPVVLS